MASETQSLSAQVLLRVAYHDSTITPITGGEEGNPRESMMNTVLSGITNISARCTNCLTRQEYSRKENVDKKTFCIQHGLGFLGFSHANVLLESSEECLQMVNFDLNLTY